MSIRVPRVMRAQASHDYGEPLPKIVSAERPGGRLQRRRVLVREKGFDRSLQFCRLVV